MVIGLLQVALDLVDLIIFVFLPLLLQLPLVALQVLRNLSQQPILVLLIKFVRIGVRLLSLFDLALQNLLRGGFIVRSNHLDQLGLVLAK